MPGRWHTDMQNLFSETHQEVEFSFVHVSEDDRVTKIRRVADVCVDETVVEYQHSRITRKEVNDRSHDYGEKLGKTVAWVIDCTENASNPHKISSEEDDEEVWMLEFEKKWQVEAMRDCKILFAVFRDANIGERIFRVPIESVRHRLVLVFGSWTDMTEWKTHVISGNMDIDIKSPNQSTLTVAQDPHGSGKTYRLTRMMIHTDLPEYARYDAYSTFIVVTKPHSAKEVVYAEFMSHLREAGFKYNEQTSNNKYIVRFTKPNGAETMCIFGTADSLMYNLCDNRMRGTDVFINLVKTIHKHGPTKLQGPKGRFRYAGQQPRLNKKTLVITDEATMLPEVYADAFATLMASCHVDVHLAGDVQQSTYFEHNLLTRVVHEFNEATDPCFLSSFQGCRVNINPGNEVRRFDQHLVDFRNIVMRGFHEEPSHNLQIKIPIAAPDVTHSRGEYSLHDIERTGAWDDPQSEQVVDAVETIMDQVKNDVITSKLLPNEILIVTPFVKNNPLMDELQTSIHEFWCRTFYDAEYVALLHEKTVDETDDAAVARIARYNDGRAHFAGNSSLPWFCVLHRSEGGKPIDTTESKYGTRIVSIHASQGDGRKFAYVVGLGEKRLTRFSDGRINLKYESLLNVAVSRMKEVIRVFLEPTYDDIWVRFLPLMPDEMRQSVPPTLNAKTKFQLLGACNITLDEAIFNLTKDKIVAASPCDASDRHDRPVLDYAHHVIRMAIAHTVFWAHLVVHQANDKDLREQVLTIFNKVAKAPIKSLPSTSYYEKLRDQPQSTIPILHYDSGLAVFDPLHARILHKMRDVQDHVCRWVRGEATDYHRQLTPEHAVLLQYAVEVFTLAPLGKENIKMDHVYDVVHCYMNKNDETHSKLERHYDYLTQLTSMFHEVKDHAKGEDWKWKIYRSISLGNKRTGNSTQYFQFNTQIAHLFVTQTRAMPIILCPSVDEMNMAVMCAQALLYTLVCIQPAQTVYKDNDKGIPTWEHVKDKTIEVCLVPIKGSRPIFIDLTQIAEENIAVLAKWICDYTKNETEADIPQALKLAEHYRDNFEEAQELVCAAHKKGKCPDYMRDAFNEADDADEVSTLLANKLKAHIRALCRDIQRR